MSEGRRVNEDEGVSGSDTHRPVFEQGVKPPLRTHTLCGEEPLARRRKVDVRGGGEDQRGGTHQIGSEHERPQTLDFQHHGIKEKSR